MLTRKRRYFIILLSILIATYLIPADLVYASGDTIASGENTVIRSDLYSYPANSDGDYDANTGTSYLSEIPPTTAHISVAGIRPEYYDMDDNPVSSLVVRDTDGSKLGKMHFLTTPVKNAALVSDETGDNEFIAGNIGVYVFYAGDLPEATFVPEEEGSVKGVNSPGKTEEIKYKTVYKNAVTLSDGTKADLTVERTTVLANFNTARQVDGLFSLVCDSRDVPNFDPGSINNTAGGLSVTGKWEGQYAISNETDMGFKVTRRDPESGKTVAVDESTQLVITDLDSYGAETVTDPSVFTRTNGPSLNEGYTYYDVDGNPLLKADGSPNLSQAAQKKAVARKRQLGYFGSYPALTDHYSYYSGSTSKRYVKAGERMTPREIDSSLPKENALPSQYGSNGIEVTSRPESYLGTIWSNTSKEDLTTTYEDVPKYANYSTTVVDSEAVTLTQGLITPVYLPHDYILYTDGIKESGGTQFTSIIQTNSQNEAGLPTRADGSADTDYWERKSGFTTGLTTKEFGLYWTGFSGCGTSYAFGGLQHLVRATSSGLYPNGGSISTKLLDPNSEPGSVGMVEKSTGPELNDGGTNQLFNALTKGLRQEFVISPNDGYKLDKFYVEGLINGEWIKVEVKPGDDNKNYSYEEIPDQPGSYKFVIKNIDADIHMDATWAKKPTLSIEKKNTNAAQQEEGVDIGDEITYEITVKNSGEANAEETSITDTLGPGLEFISASDGGQLDPEDSTKIIWKDLLVKGTNPTNNNNRMEVGTSPDAADLLGDAYDYRDDYAHKDSTKSDAGSKTVTVTVKVTDKVDPKTKVVENTAVTEDPEMTNEEPPKDTESTHTNPTLQISKVADLKHAKPGDTITYTIKVKNIGVSPAEDTTVTDNLDVNLELISAVAGADQTEATVDGRKLTWEHQYIGPKQTMTYTIKAKVSENKSSGKVENQAMAQDPEDPKTPIEVKAPTPITETGLVTRTIEYRYRTPDGQEASKTVTQTLEFEREGELDEDGNVTYPEWTAKDFPAVSSPSIDGWTPDLSNIASKSVTPESSDIHEMVIYHPQGPTGEPDETYGGQGETQNGEPQFTIGTGTLPDGGENSIVERKLYKYDPKTGEYTESEETTVDAYDSETGKKCGSYTLKDDGTIDFTPVDDKYVGDPTPCKIAAKDALDQTADTTYTPHVIASKESETKVRTISYVYDNGEPVLNDKGEPKILEQEKTFHRTAKVDSETGKVTWGSWEKKDVADVSSPEIEGFTPDLTKVDGMTGADPENYPADAQVVYSPAPPVGTDQETYGPKNSPQEVDVNDMFQVGSSKTYEGNDNKIETVLLDENGNRSSRVTVPEGEYEVKDGKIIFTPNDGFVGDPTPVTAIGIDSNGKEATAVYTPHVVDNEVSKTLKRVIEYHYYDKNGKKVTENVTQELTFTVEVSVDKQGKLGDPDWSKAKAQSFPAVNSPAEPVEKGWSVDKEIVHKMDVDPADYADEKDGTVLKTEYVIYTPNKPTGEDATSKKIKGVPQSGTPTFQVSTSTTDEETPNRFEKYELMDPKTGDPTDKIVIPKEGTYTIDPKTGEVTFTPESDFVGEGSGVTVIATDSNGKTAKARYTPNVFDPEPPTALPDETWGAPGEPQTGEPIFTVETDKVYDEDGVDEEAGENKIQNYQLMDPDTGEAVETVTIPGEGTYSIDSESGKITFQPEENFRGKGKGVQVRGTDRNGKSVTTTYTPNVVDNKETKTVTRTIEYRYESKNGKPASATVTQTATFERTGIVDPHTGKVVYPDWSSVPPQKLESKVSPTIDGWKPDQSSIPALTLNATDTDSKQVVVYHKKTTSSGKSKKHHYNVNRYQQKGASVNTGDGTILVPYLMSIGSAALGLILILWHRRRTLK